MLTLIIVMILFFWENAMGFVIRNSLYVGIGSGEL